MWLLLGIIALVLLGFAAFILSGKCPMSVEIPKYTTVETQKNVEIRDYTSIIVAEVYIPGEREKALKSGCLQLCTYMCKGNAKSQKISMTLPIFQVKKGDKWGVLLIMPEKETLLSLPAPTNHHIHIKGFQPKRFVALKFSGSTSEENLTKHSEKLMTFIKEHKLTPVSDPIYAFYNLPWTMSFFKENEVLVEVIRTL